MAVAVPKPTASMPARPGTASVPLLGRQPATEADPCLDFYVEMLRVSGTFNFRHGSLALSFPGPGPRASNESLHDHLAHNTCQMLQALVSLKSQTETTLAEDYGSFINPVGQAYRGTVGTARDILNTLSDKVHKARVTTVVASMEPKLRRLLQASEAAVQSPDMEESSKELVAAASAMALTCVSLSDIVEKGTKSYARFRPAGEVHIKIPGLQASMRELA